MIEPTFNEWWLSLNEGQRKAWMEDKWMLADISFRAGIELGKKINMDITETDIKDSFELAFDHWKEKNPYVYKFGISNSIFDCIKSSVVSYIQKHGIKGDK